MRILLLTLASLIWTFAIEAQIQGTAYESKTLTDNMSNLQLKSK